MVLQHRFEVPGRAAAGHGSPGRPTADPPPPPDTAVVQHETRVVAEHRKIKATSTATINANHSGPLASGWASLKFQIAVVVHDFTVAYGQGALLKDRCGALLAAGLVSAHLLDDDNRQLYCAQSLRPRPGPAGCAIADVAVVCGLRPGPARASSVTMCCREHPGARGRPCSTSVSVGCSDWRWPSAASSGTAAPADLRAQLPGGQQICAAARRKFSLTSSIAGGS